MVLFRRAEFLEFLHEHTRKKKAGKMKDMDADMPLFLGAPHAFHPFVLASIHTACFSPSPSGRARSQHAVVHGHRD